MVLDFPKQFSYWLIVCVVLLSVISLSTRPVFLLDNIRNFISLQRYNKKVRLQNKKSKNPEKKLKNCQPIFRKIAGGRRVSCASAVCHAIAGGPAIFKGSTPYALHPTLYTLHSTPYALHPTLSPHSTTSPHHFITSKYVLFWVSFSFPLVCLSFPKIG